MDSPEGFRPDATKTRFRGKKYFTALPEGPFVPIAWPEAKRRARFRASLTNPLNWRIENSDNANGRAVGPQSRLRALPGPPLRFSPGWQDGWAFGPKSKSDASRDPGWLFPGQSIRHILQQFVPTWPCHEAGESLREPNGDEYQNTYV